MFNFLKKIWKFITYFNLVIVNLFLLFIIVAVIFTVTNAPVPTALPKKAPLFISFTGFLVDKTTYEASPVDLLGDEFVEQEMVVRDIVYAINSATNDPRITALILDLSPLIGAGFSKTEEIGQAIEVFKTSGKPVYAYSDSYSQGQYYLASYADTVYINKLGSIALTGFGVYRNFYKEAADKLSVKFHVFRVGSYKDAVEPFIRNSMSDDSREHNARWLNELWGLYTSKVESLRQLPSGAIMSFIADIDVALKENLVSQATLVHQAGLVDQIVSRNELNQIFIEKFGKEKDSNSFVAIGLNRYLQDITPVLPSTENNIGLIVAAGAIVEGEGTAAQIGAESLSGLISQAVQDPSLKALVIRVDSGGGGAFASEVIRDEIATARNTGLPIYISMGSVAASGGYWITVDAEEVWATPSTITGSIGVFGLIPNISQSLERMGIHSDGVGTTELSDIYHIDRPLSEDARIVIQNSVDNIYREFLALVADARGMTVDEVHQIAQGRVWTGETALELGLIDKLGTLNDLMEYIAQKNNMSMYHVKTIELPLTPLEQFMKTLMEQATFVSDAIITEQLQTRFAGMENLLPRSEIREVLGTVNNAKQPTRFFAHCLNCLAP